MGEVGDRGVAVLEVELLVEPLGARLGQLGGPLLVRLGRAAELRHAVAARLGSHAEHGEHPPLGHVWLALVHLILLLGPAAEPSPCHFRYTQD